MTVDVPSIADMAETAMVPTVRSIADYIRETLIPQINDSDVTAVALSVSGQVLTVTLTTADGPISGTVTLPESTGGGEAEITEVSGEVTDGQLYITVNGETSAGIQLPTSEGGGVSSVSVSVSGQTLTVDVDGVSGQATLPTDDVVLGFRDDRPNMIQCVVNGDMDNCTGISITTPDDDTLRFTGCYYENGIYGTTAGSIDIPIGGSGDLSTLYDGDLTDLVSVSDDEIVVSRDMRIVCKYTSRNNNFSEWSVGYGEMIVRAGTWPRVPVDDSYSPSICNIGSGTLMSYYAYVLYMNVDGSDVSIIARRTATTADVTLDKVDSFAGETESGYMIYIRSRSQPIQYHREQDDRLYRQYRFPEQTP